jgi:hypothetical protein
MSPALARNARYILFCCVLSFPAHAQYAVEQQKSVWLRALLDVRLVEGGPAPSWTDQGPGKMRYGGSAQRGFRRSTRFVLSQAALQIGATLPWQVRAQAQVTIEI